MGPHKDALLQAVHELLAFVGDQPLGPALEQRLNDHYGPTTDRYAMLLALLRHGIAEGWACYSEIARCWGRCCRCRWAWGRAS
nr:DUF4863 family protein [Pseudorhodoferax sp. Leaf265]